MGLRCLGIGILTLCASIHLAGCAGVRYTSHAPEPRYLLTSDEEEALQDDREAFRQNIGKATTDEKRQEELRKYEEWKVKHAASGERTREVLARNTEIDAHNAEFENKIGGIRYYAPAPYVLVYSDGKRGIVWELHILPDTSRVLSARPYNFLATLEADFTFNTKGLLTESKVTADSTDIPVAIVEAISEVVQQMHLPAAAQDAAESDAAQRDQNAQPLAQLFKLVQTDRGIELVGGPPDVDDVLHVTLIPEADIAVDEGGEDE